MFGVLEEHFYTTAIHKCVMVENDEFIMGDQKAFGP